MATHVPPQKGVAYDLYVGLVSQADTDVLQANPTLAAGDFEISKDGAAYEAGNLDTTPVASPAASKVVKIALSADEMDADNIVVVCSDAAGDEWQDLIINIQTSANSLDSIKTDTTEILLDTGTDGVVLAAGSVNATSVADGAIDAATFAAGAIDAAAIADDAIDASAIADGAIDAATFAADTAFIGGYTSDDLLIANKALLWIGEPKIAAFSDTTKRAIAANEFYGPARDAVLELYNWKSARKLATLVQDTTYTNTAISWAANVVTVTSAAFTGVGVGDTIKIFGVLPAGYNGTYTVTTIDDPTGDDFAYALTTDPGTATAVGTTIDPVTPNWKYGNQFSLPSDFVRLIRIENEEMDYEIHGAKMVTDQSAVKIEYVYALTDVTVMNPMMRDAISAKLAYDLSYHLDTSSKKQEAMERLFDRNMAMAKNIDASQRPDDRMVADDWLRGRLNGDATYRGIS